jgi:two-component system nitrogen regulation sensor histidine kinase GlnL
MSAREIILSPKEFKNNIKKKSSEIDIKRKGYVFSVDNAFIVKTWGSGMEKLCHKSTHEVIGKNLNEVFPAFFEKVALTFIDRRKKIIRNFKNVCFLGTDLSADVQINPIKDRKGKITEVTVSLQNISGSCPIYKTISDSERMIAIGKVASTIAHGIRNPLNAIKGAVVYLNEKYGKESTLREFSKIINDEINRVDSFISDFLSSARGKREFQEIDLNGILKSIIIMIRPKTELQNITVSQSFTVMPKVVIDPFKVEQAFFNIINNALEAMPDGGTLSVRTSKTVQDGKDYAVIEISDTGKGIPRKTLTRLGELSTQSDKGDGRGYGIFLSREIIRAYGGMLFWESTKDKGTVFKILFPLNQDGKRKSSYS